ncbi:LysR family transcriptional regulator [Francisella philomiragia]
MKITIKQLRAFQAIAINQSINKAAEELYLSRSAISISISQLEEALEIELFHRTTKGLRLNDAGKELYIKISRILDQLKEVEAFRGVGLSGKLVIGASPLFAGYILPKLVPQFLKEYPDVEISIIESDTFDIEEKVQDYTIDVGFIDSVCSKEDIESIFIRKDYLKPICSQDHPLYKKQNFDIDEIFDYQYIAWKSGFGTRTIEVDTTKISKNSKFYKEWIAAGCKENENIAKLEDVTFNPNKKGQLTRADSKLIDNIVTLRGPEAIKIGVSESIAIAMMSETILSATPMLPKLRTLELDGIKQYKKLNIILHNRKYKSDLLETFVEWIKDKI